MPKLSAIILAGLSLGSAAASTTVDYVIVGGGTCGLLVANRLSEDQDTTVAVIEPGDDVRNNPNVTDPNKFLAALGTSVDWSYTSAPQPGANNRSLPYYAGNAIGGTSTINGMTYIRADAAEIDAWEQVGNAGWNWEALLPYYEKVERFTRPSPAQMGSGATYEPEYHGEEGLLKVGYLYELANGSFPGLVQRTWEGLGYWKNQDVNSGSTRGFSVWPMTVDRDADLREDAARAYFYPVETRPNLQIVKGIATKLVWDDADAGGSDSMTASGVQYLDENNRTSVVHAAREVVLSAGSLRTPLVLEMSGVGNQKIHEKLGIETVIDLPGVGENLQDQPNSGIGFTSNLNVTGKTSYATFATAEDLFGNETELIKDSTRQSLATWARQAANATSGGLRSESLARLLQVQHDLMFSKNVTIGEALTAYTQGLLYSAFWCLLPFSRGSVHLASREEINTPIIDPRFFTVDLDMQTQTAIGKLAHEFWHREPVESIVLSNATSDPASDEEWEAYIKSSFGSNSHPIGSASMMARELGGVVDSELRVYGTANVRVVDASVLPFQVSGHLTSTLYAVAERATEMMRSCT